MKLLAICLLSALGTFPLTSAATPPTQDDAVETLGCACEANFHFIVHPDWSGSIDFIDGNPCTDLEVLSTPQGDTLILGGCEETVFSGCEIAASVSGPNPGDIMFLNAASGCAQQDSDRAYDGEGVLRGALISTCSSCGLIGG